VSPLPTKQARPKSHGERLDADLEEFGDDKVAEFMENNGGTENEYEG
jgi:hypothetical protein